MTPTLLLCVSLSGWSSGEQMRELHRRLADGDPVTRALNRLRTRGASSWVPGLPSPEEMESFHRQHLEHARLGRAFREENIAWFEKFMAEEPSLFAGKLGDQTRHDLEKWRVEVQYMKKYEQVLEWYEQQRKLKPGPETELEAGERLAQCHKERDTWEKAWDRGLIAPMPREK